MLGWLRYPTGDPGGLPPGLGLGWLRYLTGGPGGLPPGFGLGWLRLPTGSGGFLPGLGSLIRDARTLNDASHPNYLNLILIIFMKFKI